jgi:hypothetical protein
MREYQFFESIIEKKILIALYTIKVCTGYYK